MANKIYTVVKDGEELEQLKTLAAAKKLADSEGAEVYCDGKCVYKGTVQEETVIEIVKADPIIAETPKQPPVEEPKIQKYRLKALMNVRRKPSMAGQIISTKPEGTVVPVLAIEKDWMHLRDNTYILYEGGKFADKVKG